MINRAGIADPRSAGQARNDPDASILAAMRLAGATTTRYSHSEAIYPYDGMETEEVA